jgi:hypothetical protein
MIEQKLERSTPATIQAVRVLPKALTDELATFSHPEKPMHPSPLTDVRTFLAAGPAPRA